ncbi:hypothetical protein S245_057982, partial [Arachis hypogaea]
FSDERVYRSSEIIYLGCVPVPAAVTDFEGKTDLNIRALEVVEELRTKRADKQ